MNRRIVLAGVILIIVAIILGAFGAHALKEVLTNQRLTSFETGIRYQVYHGLALLMLGFNSNKLLFELKWVTRLIFTGVLLFSVSIYCLAMQDVIGVSLKFLGPVTPLGGVLMIVGWSILARNLIINK